LSSYLASFFKLIPTWPFCCTVQYCTAYFNMACLSSCIFIFFWQCRLLLCRLLSVTADVIAAHPLASSVSSPPLLLSFSLIQPSSSTLMQPSHALWRHAAIAMPPHDAFPALPPLSLSVSMGHAGASELFFWTSPTDFPSFPYIPLLLASTRH
jgi:hypothetical protein